MRRTLFIAAATFMVLGIGTRAAVGATDSPRAAASSASKAPPIKPPVITESFTLLPCNNASTIGMEGCEEHKLVADDKRIDREVGLVFTILHDNAARMRLVHAQTTWFAYQQADSRSQADIYEGGSESVVAAVVCAVNDDTARSADLYEFFQGLEQGRGHLPVFP
jgi:uncharacterized protein YecT (DUF1311 family)